METTSKEYKQFLTECRDDSEKQKLLVDLLVAQGASQEDIEDWLNEME